MSRLFDSTILIAHLRGDARATEALITAASDGPYVSMISRTEIEGGMRSSERSHVARLFGGLELLPVTDRVVHRSAMELRRHRRSHPDIDLADYLIAATALEAGHELVTLNVKHFPMIPGLRPPW